MKKKLKLYNGGQVYTEDFKRSYFYVAAYNFKHCIELLNEATGSNSSPSQINAYWNKGGWGNVMQGIEPTEPCVYYTKDISDKEPKRLL